MSESLPVTDLRNLANITMGQSPDSSYVNATENGLPFLQGCAEFGPRAPTAKLHCSPPLRMAKSGSVLISVRAPVGTTNCADQDYCIGRGLGAIAAKEAIADNRFLLYAVEQNVAFLHRRSQGSTFLAVGSKELSALPVPALRLVEQHHIAEILSNLDETIAQTEALIAKYQQIKAGLMHDLFTRGVTSDGRLRPPRNEAPQLYKESPLGWIPKEWTTARLNEVGDVRLGRQRAPKYDRGVNPRPYLRVVNVADDRLDLRDVGKMDFSPSEMEQYKLRSGDIVLTEGDLVSAYNVGRSAVFNGEIDECCFQNTLIRFRPRNPEQANYLHFGFCHVRARGHLARITTATTVHHLSSGRLKEIWLPLPMNIDERLGIADRLCAVESFRDKLQAEHRKIVDLRQGVMRDLLTGRVRVKVGEAVAA